MSPDELQLVARAAVDLEPLCDLHHSHEIIDVSMPCFAETHENAPCQNSLAGQVCFLTRRMIRCKQNLEVKVAAMEVQLDVLIEMVESKGINHEFIRRIKQKNKG